jgi:hypothetical protein
VRSLFWTSDYRLATRGVWDARLIDSRGPASRVTASRRIARRESLVAGPLIVILLLALTTFCNAAELIPEASLTSLQAELTAFKSSRASSSSKRRACKGVIRDAQALIRAQPEAPNRFPVLALVLKAQQSLIQMENNERNRDAFYKTCEALAQAPDEYSAYRLNAELTLSERDLSARDADAKERTKVLAAMAQSYRNTPAELESLMAIIRIATQLGSYELKDQLVEDMSERFAGSPTAISYRRKLIGATRMDIVFSGTFERLDGTTMTFPFDRLGHPYLAVFWSKDSSASLAKLKQLKEQQQKYPDAFEIYSFNLDELLDAGRSVINSIGLKCTMLKLPGGVQSETFRTYALHVPAALRVNHFGHATVPPSMAVHFKNAEEAAAFAHSAVYDEFAYPRMEGTGHVCGYGAYDRHLSQIQSLLIGDLLVESKWLDVAESSAYAAKLRRDKMVAAQPVGSNATAVVVKPVADVKVAPDCFAAAPFRYRLTEAEALAQYKKANEFCIQMIAADPKAADLWKIRNYRIVALMGMASLGGSPAHFQEAIRESHATLGLTLPQGERVIARFCLAKEALRQDSEGAREILAGFVTQCGGDKAGQKALSAAAILAIHADSRELYQQYRSKILVSPEHTQDLAPFVSFLRNRYHQFYLFRGNPIFYLYSREYRFAERRYMIDDGLNPMTLPLPAFQLKTLDGKALSLPDTKSDRLTLFLFVEPSGKDGTELASAIYAPPVAPTPRNKNPSPSGLLASAYAVARQNNNGLQCVTVFLSDDVAKVKAIRDKYSLPGVIAVTPGGLTNPIVNRLGILSPDRDVNSFLVRRDGTIAWSKNGLPYQMSGRLIYISIMGWQAHVDVCDTEAGYRALKKKEYEKARDLFTGTHLQKGVTGDPKLTAALLQGRAWTDGKWRSSRFHGRAVANIGLKDCESGLADIDSAIAWHLRGNQFNHDPESPCSSMIHMHTTRAKALDGLGRKSEARTARNRGAVKPTDYPTYYHRIRGFNEPYEAFENRMSIVAKEIK